MKLWRNAQNAAAYFTAIYKQFCLNSELESALALVLKWVNAVAATCRLVVRSVGSLVSGIIES